MITVEKYAGMDYPPNIAEIDAVFNVANKPILFAYGTRIYNPLRIDIPRELIAHEKVHGDRQIPYLAPPMVATPEVSIEAWWRRYLQDPEFRLVEELWAHRAEYQSLMKDGNRHITRKALLETAKRLLNPLYGELPITLKMAKLIISADEAKAKRTIERRPQRND